MAGHGNILTGFGQHLPGDGVGFLPRATRFSGAFAGVVVDVQKRPASSLLSD
jgi:hypothetical protein